MDRRTPKTNSTRLTPDERQQMYRLRVLVALAASLALLLICAHLPIHESSQPVGWYLTHAGPITMDLIEAPDEGAGMTVDAPPQTEHTVEAQDDDPGEAPGADEPVRVAAPPPPKRLPGRALMANADVGSRIVGGMGAYYIHIDYPIEAIRANVQGRLLLHFTIEPNGRASNIEVAKSLHPLCDSAAVAALHATRFIPANEGGEPIPMRVQLPVRFKIEDPPVATSAEMREN